MNVLQELQEAYLNNQLIPVVGSGLSVPFHMPTWNQLIQNAARKLVHDPAILQKIKGHVESCQYLEAIDQIVDAGVAEEELLRFVALSIREEKRKTDPAAIRSNYTDLAEFKYVRFLTTNYDEYLSDFIDGRELLLTEFSHMAVNEFSRKRYQKSIIPMHGTISRPASIVFSRKSYENLYDQETFQSAFQVLRHGYTFLFLGFSFDDVYFQQLFKRVIGRFRANHYILFDESQKAKRDKIRKLAKRYGVTAIYYEAKGTDHVNGIHEFLKQIARYHDPEVPVAPLRPSWESERDPSSYWKQIDKLERFCVNYKLGPALEGYRKLMAKADFSDQPQKVQMAVYKGIVFCYGAMKKFEMAWQYYNEIAGKFDVLQGTNGILITFAQALMNVYQWDEAERLLAGAPAKERAVQLLRDIALCCRQLMPEPPEAGSRIPIYGEHAWNEEERAVHRFLYQGLRKKYIEEDGVTLTKVEEYQNNHSQELAYYWLGMAAGQLFHEHADAVRLLYQAYQIQPLTMYTEEMGHNYLSLATEKTRYNKNAFRSELGKADMMKAKRCFEFAMHDSDPGMRKSIYRSCGQEYLRVLHMMDYDLQFDAAYQKLRRHLTENYDLLYMKAEHDARYHVRLNGRALKKLNEEDRLYIRALWIFKKAEKALEEGKLAESAKDSREVIDLLDEAQDLQHENRFSLLMLDSAFNLHDRALHETCRLRLEAGGMSSPVFMARELEMEGRLKEAEEAYLKAFSDAPDVSGFIMLKAFYLRQCMADYVSALYELVLNRYPEIIYDRDDFYSSYVEAMFHGCSRKNEGFRLYARFCDEIENPVILRGLEETLKPEAMDYADCDERVDFIRQMMKNCPKQVRWQLLRGLFSLYLAQYRLEEAEQILEELRAEAPPAMYEMLKHGVAVLQGPQDRSFYQYRRPMFSAEYLLRDLARAHKNEWFIQKCFGKAGKEVILPMRVLVLMLAEHREEELSMFPKIHLAYAGIIQLQNSLICREDTLIRYANEWVQRAENLYFFSPELYDYAIELGDKKNCNPEQVQIYAYQKKRPELVLLGEELI